MDHDNESDHSSSDDVFKFIQDRMWFQGPFFSCDFEQTTDPLEPTQQFACCDNTIAGHYSFGGLVELVKFALIVAIGLMNLCEYVR